MSQIAQLAAKAHYGLMYQTLVEITHEAGWVRETGFPLPVKKNQKNADGTLTQQYRPMAIFEFIQETLSGEIAARKMRDKAALAKAEGTVT